MEYDMVARVKSKHPAFKHGGYSATAILPGEDRAKFEKLHRNLIAKYFPDGPLEEHYVAETARLIWRIDHLPIFRVAKNARESFISEERPSGSYSEQVRDLEELQAEQCAAAVKDQQEWARQELGELYDLVALGEIATVSHLEKELKLRERLGEMLGSCIKGLLQAKGLKSISTAPRLGPVRQLSAPPKAA
jgi:hypothetical protein